MSNEIVTQNIDYANTKTLETLKATIAPPDATDAEFNLFVEVCKSTGLNPFLKQIWFIKIKGYTNKAGKYVDGRLQIMTGVSGYYEIANSQPEYDGMDETVVEYREDGSIFRAIAKSYRKDRSRPSIGIAYWNEYCPAPTDKGNSIWETKPHVMISKVAESISLRKLLPHKLGATYTKEEMGRPVDIEAQVIKPELKALNASLGAKKELDAPKSKAKAEKPLQERLEAMAEAFSKEGITIDMLEGWRQGPIDKFDDQDLDKLKDIYIQITKDGVDPLSFFGGANL